MNPLHMLTLKLFKFKHALHLRLGLQVVSYLKILDQNVCVSNLFHACYMSHPAHPPSSYRLTNICVIVNLLVQPYEYVYTGPCGRYVLCVRSTACINVDRAHVT